MLRKALVIVVLIVISVVFLEGCKKQSGDSGTSGEVVKTMAEYGAEAEREIDEDNMEAELRKIEEAMESELSEEP
jgi:hypothetical protein